MTVEKPEASATPSRPATLLWVAALAAVIGFAAVYGTLGRPDNGQRGGEAAGGGVKAPSESPAHPAFSTMTSFVLKKTPEELPDISFVDASGATKSLKDFRGKALLLNLWATWCAPCREEMPALDRLQKSHGSDAFQVLALALDRGGVDAARKFLRDIKVEALEVYADPSTRAGSMLRIIGMPTTILIDKDGRERGRLPGPAEWDSAEAKSTIEAALK